MDKQINEFSRYLFCKCDKDAPNPPFILDERVRELLTSSVLRYYKDFIHEVSLEPQGKWSDTVHPFVSTIHYYAAKRGLTKENLEQICDIVNEDFINANYSNLSWNFLRSKQVTRTVAVDTQNLQGKM
ncbi:hypothetical protein AC1031_006017 [Aphanomyces cochlioides]|nr:hypothetical protein AC1031_006017 [Aphanomyces cochlioides]